MRIAEEKLKALKELMLRDYGVELTDAEAEQLGLSMLRVYRLASTALARAEVGEPLAAKQIEYGEDKV